LYHTTPRRLNVSQEELQRRLQTARPLVSHSSASRFENAGRSRNSKIFVVICVAAAFGFYFANSQTVPVTGRRRFNFLSDDFLDVLGSVNADAVVRDIEEQGGRFLSERDPRVLTVNRVMKRLVPVSGMADLEWKVRVIDDERESSSCPVLARLGQVRRMIDERLGSDAFRLQELRMHLSHLVAISSSSAAFFESAVTPMP
jgi:metalloendopeptidase OMA1, mitochondrial